MDEPIRTVLFGSYLRGYFLLKELVENPELKKFHVIGVATDDPSQRFVLPHRRIWQYEGSRNGEPLIHDAAREAHASLYNRRIDANEFRDLYFGEWKPQLALMATFGQLLPRDIFQYPALGCYNFHPCCDVPWPNYKGGDPFGNMIRDGRTHTVIAMHSVDEHFDHGDLIAYSDPIPIPPNATVVDMHKFTSPLAAKFAASQLLRLFKEEGASHAEQNG